MGMLPGGSVCWGEVELEERGSGKGAHEGIV